MPISGWWRFPTSGTEVRHEFFRVGQQSPRGGIVEQLGPRSRSTGKFIVIIADIIIDHVLGAVAAVRNSLSVRTFEEPLVLVITLDRKATLVNQFVVL